MDEKKMNAQDTSAENQEQQFSLNDDRRVKVLSPGQLVAKRFFRNRIAVVGMVILLAMFLFSFVGGLLTPYGEAEQFHRIDLQNKEYAGVTENTELRYASADGQNYSSILQAQTVLALQKNKETFNYSKKDYKLVKEGEDFYSLHEQNGALIGIAYRDVVNAAQADANLSFQFQYDALKAYTNGETAFASEGKNYTIEEDGTLLEGENQVGYVGRYVVQSVMSDVFLTREFKDATVDAIEAGEKEFAFTDTDGEAHEYTITYDASAKVWSVRQLTETRVYDAYAEPNAKHWLGTDRNGMDMLTRLMYGGRVSLVIGFIVVIIEVVLGIILGGISGYFGGWIDMLIMRIVDIFYCIPSTPIIIILGAAMDQMRVDPQIRMLYLMLLLGFLGWPGIARMVRGQILSLREQEFMTATEACGIRISRRIFRHLIPNVIPQLIVIATMGLGSTILTEATLSFLGLGVKFPFASWGNIINDVNNTYVLTNFWFIWIPAGFCLLLTVLAFNLVGDGLRDAFDPKMKR